MKKLLVLGAKGMLGNAVHGYFTSKGNIHTVGTSTDKSNSQYVYYEVGDNFRNSFESLIDDVKPAYVVNCIGFIRPDESCEDFKMAILVNSLFPQFATLCCIERNIRFIQISTDCVFNGQEGNYPDNALPNESAVYGVSKFLGEVKQLPGLTIRTSIIGRELGSWKNLLDWFLNTEQQEVEGYERVYWNGVTTLTLAQILERTINDSLAFHQPLIQIASERINKYDLLLLFQEVYGKNITINKNTSITSDKTLIPSNAQNKYFKDLVKPLRDQVVDLKNFYER